VRAIHQFLPDLSPGDAVSGHTLAIQAELRAMGLESEVYSHTTHPSLVERAQPYQRYQGSAGGDVRLLYHLAIGSVVADFVLARPEGLLVDYHNLTPGAFFADWDPPVVYGQSWGREQLRALAARTELGLADSGFNRAELVEAGYRRTTVVPILFDPSLFEREVDEPALGRLLAAKSTGGSDWLFVGRVVPNKAQHDVVKAFAAYRRVFDPKARLHLVGGTSVPSYAEAVGRYVDALGLTGAVELAGAVPSGVLAAQYRAADVFVCLSDHEGFCLPLLESMHHEVPIVALGATAVTETLGHGGLALDRKDPLTVAAAVDRVLGDERLRSRLVAAGRSRLADLSLERSRSALRQAVASLEAA
jgi:glycosyltransferase involved in cell wall biosynthesis